MGLSPLVLALDQGSSSSRALAIDSSGRVVARSQVPLATYRPRPGCFEHDPLELIHGQERALESVVSRLPRSRPVVGLGLACQRSTVIFWDRKTGRPVGRAPSWQDGRASPDIAAMAGHGPAVHEKTGLYLTPYYSAPKIRWMLSRDRRLKRLRDQGRLMVGPVSTYLIWRLTKREVFSADPTMAQRMILFNIQTGDWDADLLKLFSIPREILPGILPSVGSWGEAHCRGRRIPILASLGDQQAAALGLGASEAGASIANYGTGAFFLFNTGATLRRVPGLLTSVAWTAQGEKTRFFLEGTVHAASTAFDWLRDNFGLWKKTEDIERLCRESRERLWALPAIGGLGAPRWDYVTRTAFFGFNSRARAADMVRAVAEGIAFLISDIVERLRQDGARPDDVVASGGLSRLDYLMQFQSDILGLRLNRSQESEATALGIASLVFLAAGSPAASRLLCRVRPDRRFKPGISPARAHGLLKDWSTFVSAQESLSRRIEA